MTINKIKLCAITIVTILLFPVSYAFAKAEPCVKQWDETMLHLVCIPNSFKKYGSGYGKWVYSSELKIPLCKGEGANYIVRKRDAEAALGDHAVEYHQCTDKTCVTSKSIGVDRFTISKQDKKYSVSSYLFTLLPDENYGETCLTTRGSK